MRVAVFAIIVKLAVVAAAQSPVPARAEYRITFSALNDKGDLAEITPEDLTIEVGGRPATLHDLRHYRESPLRLVIVLDRSGSMQNNSQAEMAIFTRLLQGLPKGSSVGLIGFSDENGEVLTNPQSILNAIRKYARPDGRPQGRTRLWDAVAEGLTVFKHPEIGDTMMVLSDGGDNRSKVSFEELLKSVQASGVRVFAAAFSDPLAVTPEERYGSQNLLRLAAETGGWNLTSEPFFERDLQLKRLDPVMEKFNRALADFYVAEVTPQRSVSKRQRIKLGVRKRPGEKHKPMVTAPEFLLPGLAPCQP
jgi:Ca-activated chloride channel family protein